MKIPALNDGHRFRMYQQGDAVRVSIVDANGKVVVDVIDITEDGRLYRHGGDKATGLQIDPATGVIALAN